MTSKNVPKICDVCGNEISSELKYRLQVSQVGKKWVKGAKRQFTKANNDADMCHGCFMKMDKVGYKPDWVVLTKVGSDWLTPDEIQANIQAQVPPPATA